SYSPTTRNIEEKSSDLRLFKCDSCGIHFKQNATLMQHERIHIDSRPIVCSDYDE
ncbi:Uncharacterized protein FWK35_00016009, partial [Aphis craccivora]